MTAKASSTTLSLGSSIYTGLGYFEETFPNGTGAISGTYEDNAMLIQLYYGNTTFNLAIKGSNGLQYGIPVSNITVVYFIPHHINVTSEMTLLMFYVGVQYFLVYHHSLYTNVNEGNMGVQSTENSDISDSVAEGSFVPYIVCCHPGDCSCSDVSTYTNSSCYQLSAPYGLYNPVGNFATSVCIQYNTKSILGGTLNFNAKNVQQCIEGPGPFCAGVYQFTSGKYTLKDTNCFDDSGTFTYGTQCYSVSFTGQDAKVCECINAEYTSPCGNSFGGETRGYVEAFDIPELS